MKLIVEDILKICEGELIFGNKNEELKNFSKDTRTIEENDVYFGIKGENFDGSLLYEEAFQKGAKVCVVEKNSIDLTLVKEIPHKTLVVVSNTIDCLQKLASYKRDCYEIPFVAVTGSVGKTSTRDMIFSVLNEKYNILKTEGNYNNAIGVPLTLLRLDNHESAVIEMGMNHLGEISVLSNITKPDIGVITNVGTAHVGELGSRENILNAKLEILDGMKENGALVINNDNDLLNKYYNEKKFKTKILTIGIDNQESDIIAIDINYYDNYSEFNIVYDDKKYFIKCPIPGKAFIYNSLVSFAVGILLNIPYESIKSGIEKMTLTKNRLEFITLKNGATLINDCYNASVDSMKSSLEILKNTKAKRKIAVLGSMLELGDFSKSLHEEVGKFLCEQKIDILITVGEDAKYIKSSALQNGMDKNNVFSFDNNIKANELLKNIIKKDDLILLKASNGLHFIEIVNYLKELENNVKE